MQDQGSDHPRRPTVSLTGRGPEGIQVLGRCIWSANPVSKKWQYPVLCGHKSLGHCRGQAHGLAGCPGSVNHWTGEPSNCDGDGWCAGRRRQAGATDGQRQRHAARQRTHIATLGCDRGCVGKTGGLRVQSSKYSRRGHTAGRSGVSGGLANNHSSCGNIRNMRARNSPWRYEG